MKQARRAHKRTPEFMLFYGLNVKPGHRCLGNKVPGEIWSGEIWSGGKGRLLLDDEEWENCKDLRNFRATSEGLFSIMKDSYDLRRFNVRGRQKVSPPFANNFFKLCQKV